MATKLQAFAIGKVAKDSDEDAWEIEVEPIEILPTYSGDLNKEDKSTKNGISPFGESGTSTTTKDQRILCQWLPMNDPYLSSPPQVFAGQNVMVWKYGNLDTHFWTKINPDGTEEKIRKKEKRIIWLSNQSNCSDDNTIEKGYYFAIDTINKYVRLHTSDNDGESTTYDVSIDTESGMVAILDGAGNKIHLDSMGGNLTITTNSKIEVNTKDATINTDQATVNAESSATIKTATCTIESDLCKIN